MLGLGKLWEALIPAIAKGVGSIGGPLLLPYDTKMKAIALETLSQHMQDQNMALVGTQATFDERAVIVATFKQREDQANREAIAFQAIRDAETLLDDGRIDPTFGGTPPEPDWLNKFWRFSADVSDEDFQVLWGKILARQVAGLARVSARTLQMVSTLSKVEARFIELAARRLISYAHEDGATAVLAISLRQPSNNIAFERTANTINVAREWASDLRECGFLGDLGIGHAVKPPPTVSTIKLAAESFLPTFSKTYTTAGGLIFINGWPVTHAGTELVNLLNPSPDDDFVEAVTYTMRHQGVNLSRTGRRG
jgi:hypothetical protein